MSETISLPNFKKMISWRSGFIATTVLCLCLFAYNFLASSGKTYAASNGEIDLNQLITDKIMTYGPLILSALTGWIARLLKVKPEYVQAALDFASNKDVVEVERRFVSSVVGMVTPLLGKYPELLLSILKSMAPYFKDNPKVLEAINQLGSALVDAIFTKATDNPTPEPSSNAKSSTVTRG